MSLESYPMVSVVSVNYNGEAYLRGLLSALQLQTYPRFEVLLVDNGSQDGSIPLVEKCFPSVRLIRSETNLGFCAGNNFGIRESCGEYVALINNDTVPDPDWLLRLVEAARESSEIAGVGSKILFARPFVPVTLEISDLEPVGAAKPAGRGDPCSVFVSERTGFEGCSYPKRVLESGPYGTERMEGETGRWWRGRDTWYIPTESLDRPGYLILRVRSSEGAGPGRLKVLVGTTVVGEVEVDPTWREWRFPISAALIVRDGFELINNAGSFLHPDGRAGDRGIFEPDRGQYDSAEDVSALCGCAMLLSKAALSTVGGFDEDFFMYFEDTELSWRLRERGYRLRYQPKSVVRHFHASTSVEWSPLFNFLVSRNRILMLVKHASLRHALVAYLEELGRLWKLLKMYRSFRNVAVRTRLRLHCSLLFKAPRACLKRAGLMSD